MAEQGRFLLIGRSGVLCGSLFGLLDALRVISITKAPAVASLRVLLISTSIGAVIGAISVSIIGLILGDLTLRDLRDTSRAHRLQQGLAFLAFSVLTFSLLAFFVNQTVNLLRPSGNNLWHVFFGFVGTSMIYAAAHRLFAKFTAVHHPRFSWGASLVWALALAVIMLAEPDADVSARADAGQSSPALAKTKPAPLFPNILLVVLDTVRADHLSFYGYPKRTTPFLSAFARECTVYERAISPAPWTLPSHASLFTGLYPSVHQATSEHRSLGSQFVTLAEILQEKGYATVGFSSNSIVGHASNLSQGFEHFFEMWRSISAEGDPLNQLKLVQLFRRVFLFPIWKDKGSKRTNALIEDWLRNRQTESPGRPFFIFINYLEPHLPYVPPGPLQKEFLKEPLLAAVGELCSDDWLHVTFRFMGAKGLIDQKGYRQLAALYDGEIAYQDGRVRELMRILAQRNLLENTCIIITSDHGENLGDHGGLLDHCLSLHQSVLHVPLLIRYPRCFSMGLRYSAPVSTLSVFSTILQMTGAIGDRLTNIVSLPTKKDDPYPAFIISEYGLPVWELSLLATAAPACDIKPFAVRQKSIQTGTWKVIWRSDGKAELFNLSEDPNEISPLDPTTHKKGRELLSELARQVGLLHLPILEPPKQNLLLDKDTLESLRSLGYLEKRP